MITRRRFICVAAACSSFAADRRLAPDFRLQDAGGTFRRLSEFRGQVVVLNFWATWCRPCAREIPVLQLIHNQYSTRGLAVVGVAMDERGWAVVTPFLRERAVTYPSLLGNRFVARSYGGLQTLPHTVFIDRAGRIVATHSAALDEGRLSKIVEALLAEPTSALNTKPPAPETES